MASRVRTPSPSAADARRQRYARAHENAQRGKGDSRTQSHTYDVERGSVQSSPHRPQQYRLDAQDGSGNKHNKQLCYRDSTGCLEWHSFLWVRAQ